MKIHEFEIGSLKSDLQENCLFKECREPGELNLLNILADASAGRPLHGADRSESTRSDRKGEATDTKDAGPVKTDKKYSTEGNDLKTGREKLPYPLLPFLPSIEDLLRSKSNA